MKKEKKSTMPLWNFSKFKIILGSNQIFNNCTIKLNHAIIATTAQFPEKKLLLLWRSFKRSECSLTSTKRFFYKEYKIILNEGLNFPTALKLFSIIYLWKTLLHYSFWTANIKITHGKMLQWLAQQAGSMQSKGSIPRVSKEFCGTDL